MKKDVVKNNHVKLTGIAIMTKGVSRGPCIYLEEFFQEYEDDGMRYGEIVDEVYRLLMEHQNDLKEIDLSSFLKWETIKEKIYAKFINEEQNREMLEEMPYKMFLDLAVVYYAIAGNFGVGKQEQSWSAMSIWGCGDKMKEAFTRQQWKICALKANRNLRIWKLSWNVSFRKPLDYGKEKRGVGLWGCMS